MLRIILLALMLVAFGAEAKDGRNLTVKESTGKRIALVIGNGNYQHTNTLQKLLNPPHDAEDVAAALRGFDFEVMERKNLTRKEMKAAINEFSLKIGNSEAALFYYAGHGLQVKGQNYLMPVDAAIEINSTDADLQDEGINVSLVLENMDDAKSKANIVMLDACRAPLKEGKFRSAATRGLAAIGSPPKGTVIVYATDPGNTAADGDGRNGLFTAGLLTAFKGNDLSLHGVLVRTSKEVERGSEQKQTPYINGPATLQEEFQFAPGKGTQMASLVSAPAQQAAHVKTRDEIEQDTWDSVRDSGSISSVQEYLKQYPKGRFAGQARVLITNLKSAPSKPAEPVAPPVATIVGADNETALWTEAQKGNIKDDYDAYLTQYPKGKYVALAKSRIKKLQDEAAAEAAKKEQEAWESANQSGGEEGYQSYLKSYPQGNYASLAQVRLKKVQTDLVAARQKKQEEEAAALKKAEAEMKPGKVFKDCSDCPEMVIIPVGSFEMGSPASEAGRYDNEDPVHRVMLDKVFALGRKEITRGQFAQFVNETNHNTGDKCWTLEGENFEERSGRSWRNPGFQQEDSHPVACINWDDAKAYIGWLSKKTGKQYRLPTEAEWEYAARGNTNTVRYWGDSPDHACGYANVADKTAKELIAGASSWTVHNCSDGYAYTSPAGSFKTNVFGLNDMIGNVWEWVEDSWHDNYNGAPNDGSAWQGDGAKRVLRGGSWYNSPQNARAAIRDGYAPADRNFNNGFRLARMLR